MCRCVMDDRDVSGLVCIKWVCGRVNDDDKGEGKYCIGVNTSDLGKRLWHKIWKIPQRNV